jgi:hypothetical protein
VSWGREYFFGAFGVSRRPRPGRVMRLRAAVADRIDQVRAFLAAPTPLAWALAAVLFLALVLAAKAAPLGRLADVAYLFWLELIGGDR